MSLSVSIRAVAAARLQAAFPSQAVVASRAMPGRDGLALVPRGSKRPGQLQNLAQSTRPMAPSSSCTQGQQAEWSGLRIQRVHCKSDCRSLLPPQRHELHVCKLLATHHAIRVVAPAGAHQDDAPHDQLVLQDALAHGGQDLAAARDVRVHLAHEERGEGGVSGAGLGWRPEQRRF